MKRYGYIYRTLNLVSGSIYVGQHRGAFKPNYLGSGVILIQAIRKYGRQAFVVEFLKWARDPDHLNKLEIEYIRVHKEAGNKMYNISTGGLSGPGYWPTGRDHQSFGKKRSKESRERMSIAAKKRIRDPESCRQAGLAHRGKNHWTKKNGEFLGFSEEHLKNLSLSHMGKPSPRKGMKHSKATRAKMRKAWLTRAPMSLEQRKNLSVSTRLAWMRRKKLQVTPQN